MQNRTSQPPASDTACSIQKQTDWLATDDTFFCSPEFLEQVEQIESMAKDKLQQKRTMDFTPPSFSLGISPEKEQCASRSLDITPTTLKFSFSPKGAGTAYIAGAYYQRTNQATEMDVSLGKSQESPKHMHNTEKVVPRDVKGVHGITKPPMRKDFLDNQAKKKGKEVVVRQ